jgi:hypothetical protein
MASSRESIRALLTIINAEGMLRHATMQKQSFKVGRFGGWFATTMIVRGAIMLN